MGLKLSEAIAAMEQGLKVEYKTPDFNMWFSLNPTFSSNTLTLHTNAEYRLVFTKKHYKGATYELTQNNMNYLIEQLEYYMDKESK